ncbi:hypothetical protein B0I26_12912 [Anoxybacillus vitaminiphilus]|uniref:Uncharacterized protein n=1 Tax=Paranoxybacillus vitaminiphilus TaxID=581036 RepID=A0A327Y360_9BACL|nr:hypothetical protein [Anoxybacillus vitaminiphilus]RAK14857.1 hypothetical protein B0I26_12912 [Anoxybacillus vitaminiphilus]
MMLFNEEIDPNVKVLYVEDETGAREILARLLRRRIRHVKLAKMVKKHLNYFFRFDQMSSLLILKCL